MIFNSTSLEPFAQTVCDLISIKALSGEEKPVADYIEAFLNRIGLKATRDDQDNLVAIIEPRESGDPKRNMLHLSGHMDTVVPVEGWESDPWKPQRIGSGEEMKIAGLGASDMKSGLAVMLHLARHFSRGENTPQKLRIAISFTICEEMPVPGKRNGVNRVVAQHPGRWAITTEASCDATCPSIAIGCQGHAVAKITLKGRSAHSASPDRGLNSIHAAAKICSRVETLNKSFSDIAVLGDVQARSAAAVTMIKGGSAGNIIPEQCDLTISRRIAPGETIADVERELTELTHGLDGVNATWKLRCDAPACVAENGGPLLRAASAASQDLFNCVRYSWNRARTDLVLFKQAGMDVLNVGPGYTGQAHVAGEYVRAIDLPRSANLIAATLLKLDEFLRHE